MLICLQMSTNIQSINKEVSMSNSQAILSALANVQSYMMEHPFAKEGVNNFQKYKYRGIDQIIQSFSKPLHDNNILTVVQPDLQVRTKFLDSKSTLTRISGTIRFLSTVDGSFVDRSYLGHSKSQQGKDLEAARSFAYRNALLETFCVPFEGVVEPEETGEDESEEELTIVDRFKQEIAVAKTKASKQKIFENHDKFAEMSGDKESREAINLYYTKVIQGESNG